MLTAAFTIPQRYVNTVPGSPAEQEVRNFGDFCRQSRTPGFQGAARTGLSFNRLLPPDSPLLLPTFPDQAECRSRHRRMQSGGAAAPGNSGTCAPNPASRTREQTKCRNGNSSVLPHNLWFRTHGTPPPLQLQSAQYFQAVQPLAPEIPLPFCGNFLNPLISDISCLTTGKKGRYSLGHN